MPGKKVFTVIEWMGWSRMPRK